VIESYACCILLKLRTGADEDDDMPMDVDVKGGLDIDLQDYWAPYFAFFCLTLDCHA
jgi:hypothetical protein